MLVYMLTNLPYINLMLEPLLADCKYLIKTFLNCIVSHVYRESNRCADSLEKNESFTWYDHGFKNRTGHQTIFFKFPVQSRFLIGCWDFNRTGLAPGSQLDRPVFKTVDMISVFCMTCPCGGLAFDKAEFDFW